MFRLIILLGYLLTVESFGLLARGDGKEIRPEDELCRAINDPASGAEIILLAGEYHGPCMVRRGGTADRPLVIRAKSVDARPRIAYDGQAANVFEVRADHVIVMGLSFGPTRKNIDGIRIRANKDVSVVDCEFSSMGGIAVVANQSNLHGLRVKSNVVRNSNATAMYFGCHDGKSCQLADLTIEKNLIDGVSAADNEVGYGIQVKLNSPSIIRDNVITDTKGPGIMVYGGREVLEESLIERNFVSGSRTSSGIVIGGGPAIVRNNIAVANSQAGIALYDYGQWGLLRRIKVGFNTLYGNEAGGIMASAGKVAESVMIGNVGASLSGAPAFPPRQAGLLAEDNLVCDNSCFADAGKNDFSAAPNSLLERRVVAYKAAWQPADDFFAQSRQSPPKPGAAESVGPANKPKQHP
jgi:hypothetical protein